MLQEFHQAQAPQGFKASTSGQKKSVVVLYLTSKNVTFKVLIEIDFLLLINHNCSLLSSLQSLQDVSMSEHKETVTCFSLGQADIHRFPLFPSAWAPRQNSGPTRPSLSVSFFHIIKNSKVNLRHLTVPRERLQAPCVSRRLM